MCAVAAIPFIIAGVSAAAGLAAKAASGGATDAIVKNANQNAANARLQAQAALQSGNIQEQAQYEKTLSLLGSQRAAFAANGVDAGSGSALSLLGDTASQGAKDQQTIDSNAANRAWGYNVDAVNYQNQGIFAQWQQTKARKDFQSIWWNPLPILSGGQMPNLPASAFGSKTPTTTPVPDSSPYAASAYTSAANNYGFPTMN